MLNMTRRIFQNCKGMTLVELLAVLTITGIILILSTGILINGIRSYDSAAAETVLRDEADLIMTYLMKDIFTLKESEIQKLDHGKNNDIPYSKIVLHPDHSGEIKEIGFQGSKVLTRNGTYEIGNKSVKLLPNYSITKLESKPESGDSRNKVYRIEFTLRHAKKNKDVTFVSEVSTVNDIQ